MSFLLNFFGNQIRYKIILPYLVLTLFVMTVGATIATALVAASWEDRLQNELTQAGRNTTEALAQRERDLLNYLFIVAFAQQNEAADAPAIADAVAASNPVSVTRALRPLYEFGLKNLGLNFDRIIIIGRDGRTLVDWLHLPDSDEPFVIEGTDLSQLGVVQNILKGALVNGNDKFSGLIAFQPDPQPFFYTIVPVKQGEMVVGGILVGIKVDQLLQQIQRNSQAAITTFYSPDGSPIGSTLVRREDELPVLRMPPEAIEALRTGKAQSIFNTEIRRNEYLLAYSPLMISGNQAGYFSVGLSRDFQIRSISLNRNAIIAITMVLTAASIGTGYWIARRIAYPLSDLVRTAESVTQGNLAARASVRGADEIARLGHAFNQMTDHLLHLYTSSRELNLVIEIDEVLDVTLQTTRALVPGSQVVVLLDDLGVYRYWLGTAVDEGVSETLKDLRLPPGHPFIQSIAPSRGIELIDPYKPELAGTGLVEPLQFQSLMMLPLVIQEKLIGVLIFAHRDADAFSGAVEPSLVAVANMAASTLCNAVLFDQVNKESSERQAILRSIADGVVVCDADRKIVLVNHAAEAMLHLRDWQHRPVNFIDIPLERVQVSSDLFSAGPHNIEHYQFGHLVMTLSSASVISDEGRVLGEVIVLHDISAEMAVDRAKTDFIATISHELRTPLTVINGYTELLLRGMVGELSADQRELLEQVRARSDHMNNLFKNVIMVASIEANTLRINTEPQDLWVAVESAATPMKGAFAKKNLDLRNEVPTDLPPVLADREHLQLILTQLLDNARRYTSNGTISVGITRLDGFIQVDVRDSGPGIPADEISKLFTRFHRVEGNSSPERGSGLGLAITRQLVERQGGRVWAQSELGQGSTFSFTLQVATPNVNGHANAVVGPENADATA
jgi:signal transduction histidine kinase